MFSNEKDKVTDTYKANLFIILSYFVVVQAT